MGLVGDLVVSLVVLGGVVQTSWFGHQQEKKERYHEIPNQAHPSDTILETQDPLPNILQEDVSQITEDHLPKDIQYMQVAIIACVCMCDSFALTFLFPFVVFMVTDFNLTENPSEIGFYVGLLVSSFPFAQFLSSFVIGHLSDKIGRRPVLMWGLLANAVTLTLFGFSKSYKEAIFFRILSGLTNGNNGVSKSCLAESTRRSHHSKVFSSLSLVWGIGNIAGPSIGGLASKPAETFEFFEGTVFETYPYLLPCVIIAAGQLIGFFVSIFYLTESKGSKERYELENGITPAVSPMDTALLKTPQPAVDEIKVASPSEDEPKTRMQSILASLSATLRDTKMLLTTRAVIAIILMYALIMLAFTMFEEVFTIWAATDPSLGGLGFNSVEIGTAYSISGLVIVIVQIFLFPPIVDRIGPLVSFKVSIFAAAFVFMNIFFLRELHPLKQTHLILFWTIFMGLLSLKTVLSSFVYPPCFMLTNMAAPPGMIGATNGVVNSFTALSRTFAPFFGGMLFSWSLKTGLGYPFDYHFVGVLCAILSFTAFIFAFLYPKHVVEEEMRFIKRSKSQAEALEP
eukprot:TRINITY_DN4926_c0_g1_i2.p1 TRINITY_DN4926_c0_g1~~TRINITY_DN4926_c0_g1_i2.p1  ORF type:complete len:570 (+),score=158.97 TRINITY_DN4926_c0_g1_i2:1618-3327(+)